MRKIILIIHWSSFLRIFTVKLLEHKTKIHKMVYFEIVIILTQKVMTFSHTDEPYVVGPDSETFYNIKVF